MEKVSPNLQDIDLGFHPQAKTLARKHVNDFASSLLLQAKTIALQKRADIVLRTYP